MDIVGNIGDWWFHFGNDKKTEDDATAQEGFCLWGGTGDKANGSGCTRGKPCPGGSMHMINSRKVRCYYKNAREIRELRDALNSTPSRDPRKTMLSKIKEKFCSLSGNVFENPGGGTCLEFDTSKTLAKEYCSVDNRIAADANCTRDNLGNHYATVAANYCKTAAGQADPWCSCYNVSNNVCDSNTAAAGCAEKRQTYDKLVAATPDDYKDSWSDMEPCFGGVCRANDDGDKYLPQGYDNNCKRSVQVCVQDFDIQSIADSPINATCNLNENDGPSAGGGSSDPSNFINNLGDINNTTTQLAIGGGVGTLFMSCCCLLIIILLATSGGGGPTRFRRR
jgi:hypothetical protein